MRSRPWSAGAAHPLDLLAFVAALGLFTLTASGRCRVPDESEVYFQTESLWERRTLAIDQVPPAVFFGRVGRGGHQWAPYGPGVAFLALPAHALGRAVAAAARLSPDDPDPAAVEGGWRPLVLAYTTLASAAWAALAVAATLRAARALGATPARALLLAGLLGAATPLWPYATTFFSEASSAALVAVTAAALLEGRRLLAAVAVATLVLVKATNVLVTPALLLLAAWPADGAWGKASGAAAAAALRRAGPVLLGVVVACVVHAEWNEWRFNAGPLQLGYEWGEMLRKGEPPRAFLLSALPRGLVVLLLSPGKSLLLFAPPVVLAAWRLGALWRAAPGVAAAWAVGLVVSLVAYGSYLYPEGGYCFGPRHLVPLLPLLLLPLAVGPAPGRRALVATLAVGVPLQLLGVTVSFIEDQAMGERGQTSPYYVRHPPTSEEVPPGRPLNVYRLDYSLVRYPGTLVRHLAEVGADVEGLGVESLPLHLGRVRRAYGVLPVWPGLLPPILGALLLAVGVTGLFRRGLFQADPGVARDVSCDGSGPSPDAPTGLTAKGPSAGELRASGVEGKLPTGHRDPTEEHPS